jgi:hypothetical protein
MFWRHYVKSLIFGGGRAPAFHPDATKQKAAPTKPEMDPDF